MKKRFSQALGPILALMLFLLFQPVRDANSQEKPAQPAQPQSNAVQSGTQPAHYLGSDACMACHEDVYKKSFENTPHFKTTLGNGHGCESCHGPGSEHVEGGGDTSKIISFKTLTRQDASARCLTCHAQNLKQRHFSSSAHASNDVGCLDCHSPHHAKEPQHLLIQKEPTQCYSCHATAKAEFARPYHHRVDEGLIHCSDCHNVHGTTTLRQAKTLPSGDAACIEVPCQYARSFCVRACTGENGRLHQLPYAPWLHEPAFPASEPGQPVVPAVPYISYAGSEWPHA